MESNSRGSSEILIGISLVALMIGFCILVSKLPKLKENQSSKRAATQTTEKKQQISKIDGTYDDRENDLEELCRDYIYYRKQIAKFTFEEDMESADQARVTFKKVNIWLSEYREADIAEAFADLGETNPLPTKQLGANRNDGTR